MKKVWAVLLTSSTALLAGCGGGGGSGGSDTGGPSTSPLTAYLGTWQSACDDHDRQSVVIAFKGDGSGALELTPYGETYFKADCSGAVVATENMSAKITGKPDGAADIQVQLSQDAPASTLHIDKITSSVPAYTFQVTGAGVKYVLRFNQQQWCVDVENGESCIWDQGTQAAQSVPGGLALRGNDLFTVMQKDGKYVLDMHYVKK